MKRTLLNFAAAASVVSLLVCGASLALWVRSFSSAEGMEHNRRWIEDGQVRWRVISVHSSTRSIFLGMVSQHTPAQSGDQRWEWRLIKYRRPLTTPTDSAFWKRRIGVDWAHYNNGMSLYVIAIPHPLLAAITFVPAIVIVKQVRAARRRARLKAGRCPTCGYDLRATTQRCPECGTIPGRLEAIIAPSGAEDAASSDCGTRWY